MGGGGQGVDDGSEMIRMYSVVKCVVIIRVGP